MGVWRPKAEVEAAEAEEAAKKAAEKGEDTDLDKDGTEGPDDA